MWSDTESNSLRNSARGPAVFIGRMEVGTNDTGYGYMTSENDKTSLEAKSLNSNGNLPDLVSFEHKSSPGNIPEQLVTNGNQEAQNGLTSKDEVTSHISVAESNRPHVQDSSAADASNTDPSKIAIDAAADSVKEDDTNDECSESHQENEWLDILGNGNLKKKVLVAGKLMTRPSQGSVVTVKITARLDSGVCIQDATESFILGDGDVISALDLCVALMDEEETAEVVTSPRFAYGAKGRDPDIPSEATLTLIVQLLDVKPPVDLLKLTADERFQFGEKKRERGNDLFGREDYSGAINSYSRAVKFLDPGYGSGLQGDTSVLQDILDSKIKCYNNMAASQLKIGATDAAIRSCDEVLKCQADNIKAIYRIGKAYSSKGDTEKALSYLKKAIKLDPESKLLHKELAFLTQKRKKQSETEKTMYKRMMGSLADAAQKQKEDKSSNNLMKWSLLVGAVVVTAASMSLAYYRASH